MLRFARVQPGDVAPEEARGRLPGPESLGNGFVFAAQAGMEMTGKTVEHRDGKLIAVD